MGNEASLEGEGQPGQPGSAVPSAGAPASISAPPGSGQLIKPSNGAPAGGTGAGTGSGINSISGRPPQADPGPRAGVQTGDGTGDRLASQGEQGQGHVARKNLQVDVSSSRTGRSPSVSPDRGSAPTSPYSVPQIAPMPSSKLCPVCKTADLTGTTDGQPNFNTCTQCRSMVCNQCGFNPNPHLTEVQEWLCLNCQMQRALGMDMTTPRSKSQQQIHSPSHQAKPELQPDPPTKPAPQTQAQTQPLTQSPPQTQPQPQPQPPTQAQPPSGSNRQTGPGPGPGPGLAHGPQQPRPDQRGPGGPGAAQPHARLPPGAVPLPGMAKAPSQPDLSRNSPAHQPQPPRQDTTRSAGSSPSRQPPPPEQPFGKLFGFGASLLNQASTLISESPLQQAAPQAQPQPQQQPPKVAPKPGGPQGPAPGAGKPPGAHPGQQGPHAPPQQQQQQARQEPPSKPKPCCPLCKTSLNVGSAAEPPNYNTCTQCHAQVCNMCGFNPAPHLTEKKEWLCLNCQTQRALSGSMGEAPAPLPQPMGSPRHPAPANQLQPQQKGPNQQPGLRPTGPQQQQKPPGAQVSGPLPTVKQAGATAQTKGPTQPSPQTKGPTQASPQTKGPAQPSPQTKGPTQPSSQTKGPTQASPLTRGPTQPSSQTKGPTQPSPQTKGPTQTSPPTKGPTQTTPPTKGPTQTSPPTKGPTQTSPPTKGPTQTSPPTKGPTQTSPPTKGPTQTSPQTKGPTQPSQQSKTPNQPNTQSKSSVQTKGPGQSKGPSQTKGPAQPSTQTKSSPHPPTAKASSDSAKTSSAPAKTPGQPKSTGNNQSRKQQQAHEKTKTASKSQKEDAKTSPKKPVSEVIVSPKDVKKTEDSQKPRHHEDSNKSSTQSLSDTGYSSDGISSSQGEITGQIREEGIKLSERGAYSPSEITKLESSMRPLLESKAEQGRHQQEADDKKQRPHSLSVGQEKAYNSDEEAAREDSDDELSCKLRHDYVEDSSESGLSPLPPRQKKSHKELTDEEFMRRQILEMSADEDELEGMEGHTHHKTKKSHKHGGESAKEKRRLTQHSSSFEEDPKAADGEGDEGMLGSQGGLRRFKTIELNNTNSYNREMELSAEHDLREPELEMESLTGSPEERSRGEYSSTLPATTPSYTSGTSPTSVSSMEDDSDSSPSRRQRLEDAKQQRKARHRPHGPLLPTIEDSSEEDELREEEELLREQEQMRDLEQQRIRSTARKTKRDKEELRALRRRERSKTPPSNLSPIEDASPTEELRQAAEMEELHRSSCSEYSPSMDSEAEAFEMGSKLYKSGSEYNLPTFMSLYSPTERTAATSPSDKTLKSAEEVYEEMMRKAERMQQQQQGQSGRPGHPGHNQQTGPVEPGSKQHLETGAVLTPGSSPTQVSAPVSFSSSGADSRIPGIRVTQHLSKETQDRMRTQTAKIGGVIPPASATPASRQAASASGRAGPQSPAQAASPDPGASSLSSKMFSYFKGPSPPVSPATSPSQSPTHGPSPRRPGPGQVGGGTPTSPVPPHGAHTPQRSVSPRLARQQSSQDSPVMVITLGSETTSPAKPLTVNSSTSPLSSPTQVSRQPVYRSQAPATSSPTSPQRHPTHQSPQNALQRAEVAERVNVGMSTMATTTSTYSRGSMSMENISLCRISSVPGTTRVVEPDQRHPSGSVVDLRAPVKPAPIIMTDQGMDLTSLATDTRRYSLGAEQPAGRHTLVQPLIMNLNSQEQPYVAVSTPTTVSVTVAASMFMSQPKQPVVYGDPNSHQNRVDLGQGVGAAVCLTQVKPPVTDPSIPKIDACLEDLGIQQHQLQLQQQKLLHQQQLLEQQLQQHQQSSFARYNLANQVPPMLMKKDLVVSQTSSGTTQPVVSVSAIPRISPLPPQPAAGTAASNPPHEIYGGTVLELKNKPTVVNLSTGKPHVMMVQLDETSPSQGATVTQLVKKEEPPPPPQVLDLTGQIKPENQVACCDVVYKLPFAGSCAGSFSQRPPTTTMDRTPTTEPSQIAHPPPAPHHNAGQQQPAVRESYQMAGPQGAPEERKPYPAPPPGRIFPSMSDTNLTEVGLHYPQRNEPGDLAVDLRTMSQSYEGGYLGMGAQYGSYTDLRHQGDAAGPALPLRRYGSMSNINSEYGYGPHDPAGGPQDPNLAQYSATTAREISRMCAALSSMDQFGSRYGSNPEYMQYGAGRGGPMGRLNLQQSLASIRANLIYGPDGRPLAHGQALTNLISARQASIRALYPSALRGADGMTYSTINTPIASTLPITTQPSSVLNPMPRGIYRPYPTGVTAVPLASLTRLPHVTPRMPLSTQGPYGYPTPSQFPATAPGSLQTTGTAVQDTPMYLGKPSATAAMHTVATLPPTQTVTHLGAQSVQSTGASIPAMQVYPAGLPANQQGVHSQIPMQNVTSHPQAQFQVPPQMQAQAQQQVQAQQLPVQTQALSLTHNQPQMQPATHSQPQALVQPQTQAQPQAQPQPPPQAPAQPQPTPQTADPVASAALSPPSNAEKDKEEERLKVQQEQMLQLERERVELENLRQLRLHEELERDRLELQRHREKEQLLVQREIQELQSIKQQVLHQQQAERETQLVMQREQLAQQRMQLDQIQNLQQQLQQQLQEQKRQKTAAVEAAAAAAAAEAAAASAAAVAAATTAQNAIQGVMVGAAPQGFIICDQSGRVIQQEGQSVQFWQDGQVVQAVVATRLPSSTSEMSLRNSEEQGEPRAMKKQNSMPRLRDGGDDEQGKRITDSCVQTDDEDGEERYMSRRAGRRTRRIADCSVQTDDEDQAEWEQPVRRRRSRPSKHSDSGADHKSDGAPKVSSSSIAVQTTNNSSCQTEPDQLGRVSPAIHITMAETSKVELLHYISAPERTRKGESLACQTEPEVQSQGVVTPQLSVPTTISPYTTSLQMVGASPTDPSSQRQGVAKFERRKPDPLDIGYQQGQQQTDSPSRQPPKSPQVLYSPVSPLSPHRMLETTFASQERLNKAHVTPQQKAFTAESPQRHQSLPRPIKSVQRSMSDPKPLSPTSEDPAKNRFSPYHQQALSNSQMATLQQQQNSLMRKVKRTLPSPPPEEAPLPIVTPAMSHMYSSPGMPQRVLPRPNQGVTKAGLLHELKAVEQESSKLRKQQAELEEEEKEIDAKLRYLELGITQRKETLVKERERRELAYMRCMGDPRDYMSDSELNNLRMVAAAGTFDGNGLLSRPSTAPLSQFPNDLNAASQYGSSSAFMTYPYPQSQPPPTQQPSASYQQIGFQPPQYPTASQPQPGTFQPHPPQGPGYQTQGAYSSHTYNQPSYQTDMGMPQHGHQGFQPAGPPIPGQNLPYPSPSSYHLQPQAEILTVHQRPRQTSLADLEQKLPTNYEVISNPAVSVATSAPDAGFGSVYSAPNAYGQYRPQEPGLTHSMDSPPSAYAADGVYASNLEQNIPRNYVMIDDISELTKENAGQPADALGHPTGGRYGSENGPARGTGYEESVDAYGRPTATTGYHQQGPVDSRTGTSSYYYDDYKHSTSRSGTGSQKHPSKNLAPAVVSSKRSKHRKQGMEQKVSKFSPIEEARDVESDLASYTMTTSTGGSCTVVSRSKKLQDDITYGLKKNVYDQQKYYGSSSREALEEEDRMYGSGRSRSTGYGMDKISSRDTTAYRSKSYERDAMERSQRGSRSGRPPMRTQNSEEESPLSPVGKPVGIGRGTGVVDPHDVRNQYGSSHSLPDVQDHHMKDIPRSHVYKPDDPYLVDDMHCAVSDSEAYHLGQEETDWFEKPREARSDRSRHHGTAGHSSTGRRANVKHTYHDYDEPPEEDGWTQDEYNQRQPSSTSSRDHRHHGSSSGRHPSSRHSSEEPRPSRSSRAHPKDPSARADGRGSSSGQKRGGPDGRSSHRDSGDYSSSRDPASAHHGTGGRGQRGPGSSSRRQDPSAGPKPQQQQQPPQGPGGQQRSAGQPPSGRQPGSLPPEGAQQVPQQQQQQQPQQPQQRSQQQQPQPQPQAQPQQSQQHSQPPQTTSGGPHPTPAPTTGPGAVQQQAKPGQAPGPASAQGRQPAAGPGAGQPPATAAAPPAAAAAGMKPAAAATGAQPPKTATPPLTGIGSKAPPVGIGSRPGGIGSAAAAPPPAEGDNVLTKILGGGGAAAEQAGKLGDAVSALGKKFTSFW